MADSDFPDAFECLAAVTKFIAMSKIDPEFYQKHYHAIEMANAFTRVLAVNYPEMEKAFRETLPMGVRDSGRALGEVIPRLNWDQERVEWFDKQLTEILKGLLPVVRDEAINLWFVEFGCRWAIEGAFESG